MAAFTMIRVFFGLFIETDILTYEHLLAKPGQPSGPGPVLVDKVNRP